MSIKNSSVIMEPTFFSRKTTKSKIRKVILCVRRPNL